MQAKIIQKINKLIAEGHKLEFLKSESFSTERMKLDKLLFAKESCESGSGAVFWEWKIYCDFLRNPILSGEEAQCIVDFILGKNEDLLAKYLSD